MSPAGGTAGRTLNFGVTHTGTTRCPPAAHTSPSTPRSVHAAHAHVEESPLAAPKKHLRRHAHWARKTSCRLSPLDVRRGTRALPLAATYHLRLPPYLADVIPGPSIPDTSQLARGVVHGHGAPTPRVTPTLRRCPRERIRQGRRGQLKARNGTQREGRQHRRDGASATNASRSLRRGGVPVRHRTEEAQVRVRADASSESVRPARVRRMQQTARGRVGDAAQGEQALKVGQGRAAHRSLSSAYSHGSRAFHTTCTYNEFDGDGPPPVPALPSPSRSGAYGRVGVVVRAMGTASHRFIMATGRHGAVASVSRASMAGTCAVCEPDGRMHISYPSPAAAALSANGFAYGDANDQHLRSAAP
ncbi:hypothetical protein GGX14DRAFT_666446 [Mycena pura]|uniref:Uncharacterized protein n=1 Tax=Mycena pura TaxID=153505 RepID=A0AAD6V2R4_9AGAR|nr:hypothetical protein GGX14DRAFT_666446 [Mycena pura]